MYHKLRLHIIMIISLTELKAALR